MPLTLRTRNAYRADEKQGHKLLTKEQRAKLMGVSLLSLLLVYSANPRSRSPYPQ